MKEQRIKNLEKVFSDMILQMWLDLNDDSLKNTPLRIAKMFVNETCRWLYDDEPKITVFDNQWKYDWMVFVKDMAVKSLCEHHFQPFIGFCHIAYIPWTKIIWLSKFSRVVDWFARRPQVQEKLTSQIYEYLKEKLETENIAIYMKAEHLCMKIRWVNEHKAETITSKLWWAFLTDEKVRQEFYSVIQQS